MMGLLAALLASDDAALPARTPGGARIQRRAPAVWEVEPPAPAAARPLLVSAGVHGDETAPVELLCRVLDALADGTLAPGAPCLFAVGNPAALRAGRRHLDHDLNRLFGGRHRERPAAREAARAAALEEAVAAFCARHLGALHLDLHSAIRASLHPCFALHPCVDRGAPTDEALLRAAGIGAVVRTDAGGPVFSAHTARLGCESYTFELGRVRPLGAGADDGFLAAPEACVRALVAGAPLPPPPAHAAPPRRFRASREIVKRSEAFALAIPADAPNFTPLAPGAEIARDGEVVWRAEPGEHVLFPNAGVAVGLRAAVLVVPDDPAQGASGSGTPGAGGASCQPPPSAR